jgi:IS30 family transposase
MEKLACGKQADALAKVVIRLLYAYKNHTHTITSDNGAEFACHELIAEKLLLDFFFAHPYSSWERGLNEYTNGLIRQYIPKGTDFKEYSEQDIRQIQHKINRRPRKNLDYHTPTKKFFAYLH